MSNYLDYQRVIMRKTAQFDFCNIFCDNYARKILQADFAR